MLVDPSALVDANVSIEGRVLANSDVRGDFGTLVDPRVLADSCVFRAHRYIGVRRRPI
jgi:hypothetical protein